MNCTPIKMKFWCHCTTSPVHVWRDKPFFFASSKPVYYPGLQNEWAVGNVQNNEYFFFRKKKKFKFSLQITERESVLMDSMSVACTMQEKWRWRKSENLIYFYVIFSSLFFFLMNFIHGCICAVCSGTSLRREREEGRKKWE